MSKFVNYKTTMNAIQGINTEQRDSDWVSLCTGMPKEGLEEMVCKLRIKMAKMT